MSHQLICYCLYRAHSLSKGHFLLDSLCRQGLARRKMSWKEVLSKYEIWYGLFVEMVLTRFITSLGCNNFVLIVCLCHASCILHKNEAEFVKIQGIEAWVPLEMSGVKIYMLYCFEHRRSQFSGAFMLFMLCMYYSVHTVQSSPVRILESKYYPWYSHMHRHKY